MRYFLLLVLTGPREILNLLAIEKEVFAHPVVDYTAHSVTNLVRVAHDLAVAIGLLDSQEKLCLLFQSLAVLLNNRLQMTFEGVAMIGVREHQFNARLHRLGALPAFLDRTGVDQMDFVFVNLRSVLRELPISEQAEHQRPKDACLAPAVLAEHDRDIFPALGES